MKLILILFAVTAVVIGGATLSAHLQLPQDRQLILHVDPVGQPDLIGGQKEVYRLLAVGGVVTFVNLLIAYALARREHFLAVVVSVLTLFGGVLLFIVTSVIISNNS